jgi:hypothetical protein
MRLKYHGEDEDFITFSRELFGLEPNEPGQRWGFTATGEPASEGVLPLARSA